MLQAVFGVNQAPPNDGTLTLRCPGGSELTVSCGVTNRGKRANGQLRAPVYRIGRVGALGLSLGADVSDVLAFRNLSPGVASVELLAPESQAS